MKKAAFQTIIQQTLSTFCLHLVTFVTLISCTKQPLDHSPRLEREQENRTARSLTATDEYDYIIVGCGTAGSALARKLSDDKSTNVLVLETGINRSADAAITVVNFDTNTLNYDPRYSVTYTQPPFEPTGSIVTYSEGKMWGGSSGRHYLNAVRGIPSAYDKWAELSNNSRWSYNSLLPTMKAIESYVSNGAPVNTQERGIAGPVAITQSRPVTTNPVAIALQEAMDIPFVDDYNDGTQSLVGVSARQLYVTPGQNSKRSWAIPSFLTVGTIVDANGNGLDGRKLQIVSNAEVARVLFDNKQAKGVECTLNGKNKAIKKFYAKKKIILAAGAINTPCILQRSGVGDAALLNSLHIPLIYDNPNVGSNLQDHYGVVSFLEGKTDDDVLAFTDLHPYMPKDGMRRAEFFAQNVDGKLRLLAWNMHPRSTGSLHIVDVDPSTQPKILFNLYSDGPYTMLGTDAYVSVKLFQIMKSVADRLKMKLLSPPIADFTDEAKLFHDAQVPPNFTISHHIVGTARMSTSAKSGVVDGNLQVFGVEGLMVADISISPMLPTGNPCYAAYVIGMEAANILLHE